MQLSTPRFPQIVLTSKQLHLVHTRLFPGEVSFASLIDGSEIFS